MAVRRGATLHGATLDQPRGADDATASGSSGQFLRLSRLWRNLDSPFVRNAYSLVGSSLATSVLGLAFWTAAAWAFSKEDVGRNAALISTMLFLSSISQLNLTNGFNRFVPTAGVGTRRLVLVGYAASTITAAVAASIFVLGVDLWAPRLSLLQDNWPYALWFVGGTVVYTVFALQDAVLTGLGEARWVLVENVLAGIAKLAFLVTVALAMPVLGVFASWTIPLTVAVAAVNVLIFRRLIPARTHPPLEPVDARMVRRYVGFDMVGTVMLSATIGLLPVIVLAISGPSASAYLYLTWTIAYTLYLVSLGVGMSFVTESARAPERIIELARDMIRHSLRLVAPMAIVVALAAPLILRVFPQEYSSHATNLLRLLALSAIPNVVTVTYLNIARVQRRLGAVIAVTGALAVGVLTLSIVLTHVMGVTGVGVAWLASQTALALVLLLGELRTVWLPYVPVHRLRALASRGSAASRWSRPRTTHHDGLDEVAEALESAGLTAQGWAATDVLEDTDAIRVVAVRDGRDEALLKVATSEFGAEALRRETAALTEVRDVTPALAPMVPRPLRTGAGASVWTLETRCPGIDARTTLTRAELRTALLADLGSRMGSLYQATATRVRVDADLPELLDLPIAAMDALPTTALRVTADATSLIRLQSELAEELTRGEVTAARVHGNLWLGNLRCRAVDGGLTGVVNWERSGTDLPAVELMHLVCTTRALVEGIELGGVVRAVLAAGRLRDDEAELLASMPGAAELSPRTAVLLMWLRHVQGYTQRVAGARPSEVWMSHNVHQVLESV